MEKGCIVGFFTLLIVLYTNQITFYFLNRYFISNFAVFWIGLIAAFGSSFILNVKTKRTE